MKIPQTFVPDRSLEDTIKTYLDSKKYENNEDTRRLNDQIISVMVEKLGYHKECAEKTLEYFCTRRR